MNRADKSLRSLNFLDRYRTGQNNVVNDFYIAAFKASTHYSRAVGYFTSSSLSLYARGLEKFADRGGQMRLIASPNLNQDDINDIQRGYDIRGVLENATLRELTYDADADADVMHGLGLVGRCIAENQLDIKLAFIDQGGNFGLYHEKIGVFRDARGDLISFTGSNNETVGGLEANFESIEVYRGWTAEDSSRALRLEADFESLWNDETSGLRIESFPEVAKERLISIGKSYAKKFDTRSNTRHSDRHKANALVIPTNLEVRDYQRVAVESWLKNQGRGMFRMATGTGKTKTALFAASQLSTVLRHKAQPLVVLVLAPLSDLVDQWTEEIEEFGISPIAVHEDSNVWYPKVEEQLASMRLGQRQVMGMVATNASFSGEKFQSILTRIKLPLLVIGDEAHNLGASKYRLALPDNATYRLGLSATPERWNDDEGTAAIVDYFGPITYELGLEKAISMGALTKYEYYPRLVELNQGEAEMYAHLTAQIAKMMTSFEGSDNDDPESPLGALLRRRSNILGHAAGKLPALRDDLAGRLDDGFQLIYCGEGRRPTDSPEVQGPIQMDEVMNLVGNDLKISAHTYFSGTSRSERKELLSRFESPDDLKVLVAMRCLDEGVDIPDARTGYILASSSNPRQFIQRRGRLLRRSPGKDKATIIDYLAIPPANIVTNFKVERALLTRELSRANEFAKLSTNYSYSLKTLRPVKERYHLMDM